MIAPEFRAEGTSMRVRGRTFYAASALLGRRREPVLRLYALCRYVDDIADSPGDVQARQAALDTLQEALRVRDSNVPWVAEAVALANTDGLPLAGLRRLIAGAREDIAFVRPADEAALLRYAYGVAGVVGDMMCPLLGAAGAQARQPAVALGVAMQLTNIARDVREDAAMGRIYLPAAWAPWLTPHALGAAEPDAVGAALPAVARLVEIADRYYRLAEAGMPLLPVRSRLAVRSAARMYRQIGLRVVRVGGSSLHERVVVPPLRRHASMLSAIVGLRPRFACAAGSMALVLRDEMAALDVG